VENKINTSMITFTLVREESLFHAIILGKMSMMIHMYQWEHQMRKVSALQEVQLLSTISFVILSQP
jgi:hypothetical protein